MLNEITSNTPLHQLAGDSLFCKGASRLERLARLLEHGAHPHVVTPKGKTPRDVAKEKGCTTILEMLNNHKCAEVCV